MDDATADFFQIAGEREYWTGYDIGREFELAKIDDHDWIPEETRAKVCEWAKTKTVPVRPRDDGRNRLYRPIVDPYEIRVLEVKPGAKGDKLRGSLHHCSVEYVDPEPYNQSFIRVRYALSMDNLVTPISYTALSYTWGEPIFDAMIECDGHEKAITKSLESALLHFRREDESVVLWIDQICIDQSNNDEKGQQIPLMSRIYQRATNTAIWLGEASEGSDVAIKLLEEVNIRLQFTTEDDIDPKEFERMRLPAPESKDWSALWDLLSRQWFTRVWIIQEVILSRDPWVACGDSLITWENLSSGCMQLVTTGISAWLRKEAAKGPAKGSKMDDRGDMCELAWQLHRMKQSAQDSDNTLVPLLVQSRGAQCYDSRDKVYGLLGVVNEDHQAAVKVSYADDFPAAKLYQQVVAHHVSQHPTRWALHEVLACVDHDSPHLPSWVPDWSRPRLTVALGYTTASQGIYRAHGTFERKMWISEDFKDWERLPVRGDEMSVQGFLIDTISTTSRVIGNPDLTFEDPMNGNQTLLEVWKLVSEMVTYPQPHTLFSALCQTLVAGRNETGKQKCPQSYEEIISLLLDASTGMEPSISGQTYTARQKKPKGRGRLELGRLKDHKVGSAGDTFQELRTAMVNALKNRKLGTTEKGHLGLFLGHANVGDQVYVLENCHVPFVMRKIEGGRFRLVGECYVHGMMHGEAIGSDASLTEMVLV
ncbi:heterokaryon incompatibility protein [Colletotrichum gloeosporioides Cg-14]|uniref:Heterokaryon incompatibility protein n=1 Tax=Colletotrichum gloeosporioides (strain Cg-14) TaxID=1237896 RepID=T0K3V8_COLGC|nr:heterokaryon incompatibility protein [Colletotrichum gloeosporioides Cg-14]